MRSGSWKADGAGNLIARPTESYAAENRRAWYVVWGMLSWKIGVAAGGERWIAGTLMEWTISKLESLWRGQLDSWTDMQWRIDVLGMESGDA